MTHADQEKIEQLTERWTDALELATKWFNRCAHAEKQVKEAAAMLQECNAGDERIARVLATLKEPA